MQQPFPRAWIDRVFGLLQARYGSAWVAKWAGVDVEALRADWCTVLAGLQINPDAVRYGLDNLPDLPPTATQFCAICNRRPEPAALALPAPTVDPDVVRNVVGKLREAFSSARRSPLEWAHRLAEQERDGKRLTIAQRDAWREALRADTSVDVQQVGSFTPMPQDALPPGMRGSQQCPEWPGQ